VRLARVLRMPPDELVFRGREEARKWLDRWGALALPADKPTSAAALDHFHARCRTHFFAGAVSDETPGLLSQHAPRAARSVFDIADAACAGRFDLLGYRGLDFGRPVDWHLDPVATRRAPLLHWSHMRPLDARCVGDSKVIWELNRHQWMVALGQAYRSTGDERYAARFIGYLQEWWDANPRGRGINWTSSLELAVRLIAWCWALALLRGSRQVTTDFVHRMRQSVVEQAVHIERHLSRYFSPNTHLTGEALGLFYAGLLFPDSSGADRWRTLGSRLLVQESARQVLEDGVYFEQSTSYQCYTVEIYLHFLVLARRSGLAVPAEVGARIQRLLDFLLFVRRPDGRLPAIGDADGGRLLPLAPRAPDDARGLFAVGAALFARSDYAWAADGVAPELLWLLGADGLATFRSLAPRPPASSPSRLFVDGGYAVQRSGWGPAAHQLIFDVGPLGCPTSGAHGHADLLSVQVSAFGEAFLVDPGTCVYTADPQWRDHFRSSQAHNTVTVDGESQARPAGPFSWKERPHARFRRWQATEDLTLADADHDAYGRLGEPIRHRRRVLFVKRKLWLIVDDVEGGGHHHIEQRFQLAPIAVTMESDGWIRARGASGRCLWLRAHSMTPLAVRVHAGDTEPAAGWISPDYGQRVPAPMMVVATRAALPLRIVTLLVPRERPDALPPAVEIVTGHGGIVAGLRVDGEDVVVS
jgi:uncharacterized heparinase superfamily protein